VPAALEEPRAETLFQRNDLLAEGRLTDVQRFGRVAEVPQLSDGQEGTQEFEFHSKR
jgi:hypothetical protein